MTYKYEYTKEETEDPNWEKSLGKLFRYQYGCNGCGGSFDPNYGGEIEEETGRLNMCGSCLDKDFIAWAMNTHPIVYNRLRKAYDEVRKE
tara:strand:+ start:313 stop:582 length:270 start_codon:yes stop_codon:yes gene_type:complete